MPQGMRKTSLCLRKADDTPDQPRRNMRRQADDEMADKILFMLKIVERIKTIEADKKLVNELADSIEHFTGRLVKRTFIEMKHDILDFQFENLFIIDKIMSKNIC